MATKFDATKPLKVGKYTISDYHAQKRPLTLPEVFVHSSNIGTALMAQSLGGEKLRNFYSDLGLLSMLDVEISEIASPMEPMRWGEIGTMTASYGHGVATTPLQVVAALSMVSNGGYYVRPTFIGEEAQLQQAKDNNLRVMSEETSYKMRELLSLVVTEGTGRHANVPGYRVGGKTGTAEKPSSTGGYDAKRLISSFAGVFPMDNPRYAIFVAVDEPKGTHQSFGYATAGWVAAPVVGQVVRSIASILGIAPHPEAEGYENPLAKYLTVEG